MYIRLEQSVGTVTLDYDIKDEPFKYVNQLDLIRIPDEIIIFISDVNNIGNDIMIYADNKECFDKISKCPMQLPYPTTEEEFEFVYEYCAFLNTNEGFKASDTYYFDLWVNKYPKETL